MRWMEPNAEQVAGWKEWVANRPRKVRTVAKRFDPWTLYQLGNVRCRLYCFDDPHDGGPVTVKVDILACDNPGGILFMERRVFGVKPSELKPVAEEAKA